MVLTLFSLFCFPGGLNFPVLHFFFFWARISFLAQRILEEKHCFFHLDKKVSFSCGHYSTPYLAWLMRCIELILFGDNRYSARKTQISSRTPRRWRNRKFIESMSLNSYIFKVVSILPAIFWWQQISWSYMYWKIACLLLKLIDRQLHYVTSFKVGRYYDDFRGGSLWLQARTKKTTFIWKSW